MQCTHHTYTLTHSDPYNFHAFGLCIVFVFVGGPRGKTVFSLFYASQPIKMSIVWYGVSNTINTRAEHIFHLALLSLNAVRILQTQRTAATPIRNPYLTITDHRYRYMKPHHRMNSMRRDERITQSIVLIFANCRTTMKMEWKKRSLFCLYISYRTVCSCPSNR